MAVKRSNETVLDSIASRLPFGTTPVCINESCLPFLCGFVSAFGCWAALLLQFLQSTHSENGVSDHRDASSKGSTSGRWIVGLRSSILRVGERFCELCKPANAGTFEHGTSIATPVKGTTSWRTLRLTVVLKGSGRTKKRCSVFGNSGGSRASRRGERNTWRTIRNIRRSSFFTFNGKGGSTLCRLAKSWLSKSRHTQPRARASCLRRKEATRGPSQGLGSPTDFPCSAPYSDMRCNLRREGGSPPTAVFGCKRCSWLRACHRMPGQQVL
jgi:hypothetical protein